ncbi:ABC transporter ATP-binding protein [Pseudoclavibacter sp. 8L]|uniref:ABC transporter ATP-binding protein n=1 Tax=Pseudoclavibacter sp. 8L TaxID=2653162 RepID=UPI0012F388F9|nr:ABC transporter ATP-binding protein [Pseudoclavibacter sp. 8L]VXB85022.1 ABC transporter ATP-binding protein [Pseudoclavibacter sp. 8L]
MGARVEARGWGWRHADRAKLAVSQLDLTIEPGEAVLLLGPSGAGKSTLLAALAGVLGDHEDDGQELGSLLVDGRHPTDARGAVGLVLQDPQANTVLARIGDDIAFGCENLGVPRAETWVRVREALDAVGLRMPLDRSTAQLSGGERQRLAIAGVLAMRPNLILLDEPTANLDPAGVEEVREAVVRAAEVTGATLIVIEHRVDVWRSSVDRVVVLGTEQHLLADGAPDVILEEQRESLLAAGVWIGGHEPTVPRGERAPGEDLLVADGLGFGRADYPLHTQFGATLRAGESTVVLGPNGAGKTTLALTLAGLLKPVAGDVRASSALREAGEDADRRRAGWALGRFRAAGPVGPHPSAWRSRQLLTRIGTVFQQPEHQFVAGTVRRELEVGPDAVGRGRRETSERVDELLAALRLSHLAEAHPFTLSGGEQRRLSVATVLATAPRVLIFDEPTFGQDRRTWTELVTIMSRLVSEGHSLVSVTHDEQLVRVLGDQRIRIEAHDRKNEKVPA